MPTAEELLSTPNADIAGNNESNKVVNLERQVEIEDLERTPKSSSSTSSSSSSSSSSSDDDGEDIVQNVNTSPNGPSSSSKKKECNGLSYVPIPSQII